MSKLQIDGLVEEDFGDVKDVPAHRLDKKCR